MKIHIPADFTLAELRAFVRGEAQEAPEGYHTAREWATRFKVHPKRMRELLGQAKAKDLIDVMQDRRETLDGRETLVPVYAFVKAKDEETISDSD